MPPYFNFTLFETVVLPAWIELFTLDFNSGAFSYHQRSNEPDLFGTIDVTHVLSSTGVLQEFDDGLRDAWKATIDAYQDPSGFYHTPSVHHKKTSSLHWCAGEATASLALLERFPKLNNSNYTALASGNASSWTSFFGPLVAADGLCYKPSLGTSDFHACGKIFGAPAAVLAYTAGHTFDVFFRWWVDYLANVTDTRLGVVCPQHNSTSALFSCLGGGMATHGIQLGLNLGDFASKLAYPTQLLDFAAGLQNPDDGTFDSDPGSMTLDGIFQITRPGLQLGVLHTDPRIRTACERLMKTQERTLNNRTHVLGNWANNSHQLPNIVAAVAECASKFPDLVITQRQWSCCARYV